MSPLQYLYSKVREFAGPTIDGTSLAVTASLETVDRAVPFVNRCILGFIKFSLISAVIVMVLHIILPGGNGGQRRTPRATAETMDRVVAYIDEHPHAAPSSLAEAEHSINTAAFHWGLSRDRPADRPLIPFPSHSRSVLSKDAPATEGYLFSQELQLHMLPASRVR